MHVYLNAISPRGDAAPMPAGTGYGRARAGLRSLDSFGDEIRRRQDALRAPHVDRAVSPAHASLGGALAAYLASEAGQKALGNVAHAVVDLARQFFVHGPEQLPLPLA